VDKLQSRPPHTTRQNIHLGHDNTLQPIRLRGKNLAVSTPNILQRLIIETSHSLHTDKYDLFAWHSFFQFTGFLLKRRKGKFEETGEATQG